MSTNRYSGDKFDPAKYHKRLNRMVSAAFTWRDGIDIADEATLYAYDEAGALDYGAQRPFCFRSSSQHT